MNSDDRIQIKDVYDIVERLEDKFDKRFDTFTSEIQKLGSQLERIDREGSIGTRDQLADQDRRLEDHSRRLRDIEARSPVTREDLHKVKDDIAALRLWQASLTAVASLKRWQVTVGLGLLGVVSGLIGSLATFYWLHHG